MTDWRRGPSDWSRGHMQSKVRQIPNDVPWGFMDSPYLLWIGCRNKLSLRQHKPLGATRKRPHILPSRADKNGPVALHCSRSHFPAACLALTTINPFATWCPGSVFRLMVSVGCPIKWLANLQMMIVYFITNKTNKKVDRIRPRRCHLFSPHSLLDSKTLVIFCFSLKLSV